MIMSFTPLASSPFSSARPTAEGNDTPMSGTDDYHGSHESISSGRLGNSVLNEREDPLEAVTVLENWAELGL